MGLRARRVLRVWHLEANGKRKGLHLILDFHVKFVKVFFFFFNLKDTVIAV